MTTDKQPQSNHVLTNTGTGPTWNGIDNQTIRDAIYQAKAGVQIKYYWYCQECGKKTGNISWCMGKMRCYDCFEIKATHPTPDFIITNDGA